MRSTTRVAGTRMVAFVEMIRYDQHCGDTARVHTLYLTAKGWRSVIATYGQSTIHGQLTDAQILVVLGWLASFDSFAAVVAWTTILPTTKAQILFVLGWFARIGSLLI